jgi:hypothetical protein
MVDHQSPQTESPNSQRQMAAMRLYLDIGRAARPELPAEAFPGQMHCGGESLRPDKAIIEVFVEKGLLTHRLWGAQLMFDLASSAGLYFEQWESSGRVSPPPAQ